MRSENSAAESAAAHALMIGTTDEGVKSGAETTSRMQLRTVFRACPLDRKGNRLCWRDSTNADVEVAVYDGGPLTTDLLSPHCWNVMMEGCKWQVARG